MSDQNQELLDAIAALMEQRQDGSGSQGAAAPAPAADPEPEKSDDFDERLAACERIANR